MSKYLLIIALAIGGPTLVPAQGLPSATRVAEMADSLGKAFIAGHGAPSVVIGIVRGTDTIAYSAYGMADLENSVAARPDAVYRTGSVTKQFTAALVMRLVEQLKVRLSDPIAKFIPNLPTAWQPVTIRQLLNHTSGIPSYTSLGPLWHRRWAEEMIPDTIVAMVRDRPMDFAPATKWAYNNTGYVLLGMLIEKVSGTTWGEAVHTQLAQPLGLTDTAVCHNTPLVPRRVHGYEPSADGGWQNAPYLAMSQPYAAGALCSTIGDMIKWNQALHNGKVVSAESYAAMTSPDTVANGYGFGLIVDSVIGHRVVLHGGGIHGFSAANLFAPASATSITVFTNSGSARASRLLQQLVRAALGLPLLN
jgi:CubicO group peptidase (beta-lactamase class C family)